MLYGKILRPPAHGAKLVELDLTPAKAMKGVVAVRDDQFAGVAAPTSFLAEKAIAALADHAKWETGNGVSSASLFDDLKKHARDGVPSKRQHESHEQQHRPLKRRRCRATPCPK